MKIICLQAENIKRLRAVEIRPTTALVQVTGKNGQGKSSVLDAIYYALAGAGTLPPEPIRRGAQTARIRLDLGELVVTRKLDRSGTTLTVEGQDGARFSSPQRMLDALVGSISFDPLAFANMTKREQYEELLRVVKLPIDPQAMDALSERDVHKRTEVLRDAQALRAAAAAQAFPANTPDVAPDVAALVGELRAAGEKNAELEARRQRRLQVASQVTQWRAQADERLAEAERLRAMAATAERAAETLRAEALELEAKLAAAGELPAPIDTQALVDQIEAARVTAAHVKNKQHAAELLAKIALREAEARELAEGVEVRRGLKNRALAGADLPVRGLSLGDGEVLIDGFPLEQASDSERLRISVALAMAANPKLRVLRIRDGSLLDDDGLALLAQLAEESDYQVWLERVDSTGQVGVVMVDGRVKEEA
jgi:hypothetical protein